MTASASSSQVYLAYGMPGAHRSPTTEMATAAAPRIKPQDSRRGTRGPVQYRNIAKLRCSSFATHAGSSAAEAVCVAALVVSAPAAATSATFAEICCDPTATSSTLRLISLAIAVCSSTAAAIAVWVALMLLRDGQVTQHT